MNDQAGEVHERGVLPLLMSMLGTRLDLAVLDTGGHFKTTHVAMLATFVALVLALVAFTFVGIAVIVLFWDTHRIAASVSVLGAYVGLAVLVALRARADWKSRPAAFTATLHELELDRAALRSRP